MVEVTVYKQRFSGTSTDVSMQVQSYVNENAGLWDRGKIITSLMEEAKLKDEQLAEDIAKAVENRLSATGLKSISTSIIRELITSEFLDRGLNKQLVSSSQISMPLEDIDNFINDHNTINSNVHFSRAGVDFAINEVINKQYALRKIFSNKVEKAHYDGQIYIHDLGILSYYCSSHSPAYVARYGLKLDTVDSHSSPARTAEVLVHHLITFMATMSNYFAGAVAYMFHNIILAPYVTKQEWLNHIGEAIELLDQETLKSWLKKSVFAKDLTEKEKQLQKPYEKWVKQIAQMFIFSISQESFAKGGQVQFNDVNLYTAIPNYLKNTKAVLPGGEMPGNTYSEFEEEAQLYFLKHIEVMKQGDKNGMPFVFPKLQAHIGKDSFENENELRIVDALCDCTAHNGSPYFLFDRGTETKMSMCCRLTIDMNVITGNQVSNGEVKDITALRFASPGNVTINLPRACLKAKGDWDKFIHEMDKALDLAALAHEQKRRFLKKIFNQKNGGMLSMLTHAEDGNSYVNIDNDPFLMGVIGIDDCVKLLTGKRMHESAKSVKKGLEIMVHFKNKCKALAKEHNMTIAPVQTPAESAGNRLARMDVKEYDGYALNIVTGDPNNPVTYYYTNSTQLQLNADVDIPTRISIEGKFHAGLSGAITHIYSQEKTPSINSLKHIIKTTLKETNNTQIVFSPTFTQCNKCNTVLKGYKEKCENCGSKEVEYMTRIVGYYSKINGWNPSKKHEYMLRNFNDKYYEG